MHLQALETIQSRIHPVLVFADCVQVHSSSRMRQAAICSCNSTFAMKAGDCLPVSLHSQMIDFTQNGQLCL